jgi:serine kinase of HPr protein (carbohydrate metabolism regulator)
MTASPTILHATTVTRFGPQGWRGVLLRGPSGAGKSDLALRLLFAGWRLVADDRSLVWLSDGRLYARAPQPLKDLIEARGLGVLAQPALGQTRVILAVDCAAEGCEVERTPEDETVRVLQAQLSRVQVYAKEASAAVKVALALDICERRFDTGGHQRI